MLDRQIWICVEPPLPAFWKMSRRKQLFTNSAPLGRVGHRVAMSVCVCVCLCHRKTPTSGGRVDLWSKGLSLILAYFYMFLSFCVLDEFFRFSKKLGFWVFLVHPTVVSVLLSASVKRCFVSRMRDFYI